MPTQEELQAQQELLAAHRRTLAVYLKQRALHGEAFVPPAVEHGMRESRQQIRAIKARLRTWGEPVADHPDDEETSDTTPGTARKRLARVFVISGTLIALTGFGIFGYVIVTILMIIFMTIFSNPTTPPDFSRVFAGVPLHLLPLGIGVFFGGAVMIVIGNLISGERLLSRR